MQECFHLKAISTTVNKTLMVLIPNIKGPSKINQFRPISLCNFAYKVVSKILASKLNQIMHKIISDNQSAFFKHRWIAENTILAQEIVHKVKITKGKGGLVIIKFDLRKAYDKLE